MSPESPDPRPAAEVTPYTPIIWPVGMVRDLDKPQHIAQSYGDVLAGRRSNRNFGKLTLKDLSALLWSSCRQIGHAPSDLGFDLSFRPAPSAGAIHPIHVLSCSFESNVWLRYDPVLHNLIEVPCGLLPPQAAIEEVSPALSIQQGTILWLAAETGKTASKYDNIDSLIWRDAGALLAHLGLAASSLGLNFCPLGATGAKWGIGLDQTKLIRGVGVAFVGSPAISDISRDSIHL